MLTVNTGLYGDGDRKWMPRIQLPLFQMRDRSYLRSALFFINRQKRLVSSHVDRLLMIVESDCQHWEISRVKME